MPIYSTGEISGSSDDTARFSADVDIVGGNLAVSGTLKVGVNTTTLLGHLSGTSAAFGGTVSFAEDLAVSGTMKVGDDTTLKGHLSGTSATFGQSILVHDDANITGSVNVGENIDLAGDIDVDGTANLDNTDIDGTLAVDGTTISLDATTSLNIDNSNTSNGITIGTATSGVPISIGHTTSQTTVNDNLTVTGQFSGSSGTFSQGLLVHNDADVTGSLTVAGSITGGTFAHISGSSAAFGQSILVHDDANITGSLDVKGTITGGAFGHISGSSAAFGQSLLVHDDANITGSVNVKGLTHAIGGLGVTGSAVHTVSSDLPMTASLLYNTSNDPDAQVKLVIQNDQHNKLVLGKGSSTFIDSSTGNGDVKFNLSTITSTSGALLIRTDGGGDVQASGYGTFRDSIWLHQTTGDYMPDGGLVLHNHNKVTVGQHFNQDSYDFQSSGKLTTAFNVLGNARVTGSLTVDGHVSGSSAAFGQSVLVHDDISVTGSIFTAIGIAAGGDGGDITFKQYDGVESARVVDGNEYAVLTVGASTINHLSGAARGGFNYKMPVALLRNSGSYTYNHIDHPAGARRVPLDASMSGYLIKVNGNSASNDMEIILPSSGSIRQLDGVHFKIITTQALHSSANLFIRHPNPSSAIGFIANILSVSGTVGGSYSGYATDKKLKVAQSCPAGAVIDLTCIDGGTQNGGFETWVIEAKSAGNFITLEDE